jgi:quercetin dioxygenase-like cupin family protein
MSSAAFVLSAETPWQMMSEGIRRQILGHGPDLMMVRVDFEKRAVGALHHHPHRQVTWVASGSFDVSIGNETKRLTVGDSFFAVAGVEHGVVAVEAGTLIDVFTPAREDFLGATR